MPCSDISSPVPAPVRGGLGFMGLLACGWYGVTRTLIELMNGFGRVESLTVAFSSISTPASASEGKARFRCATPLSSGHEKLGMPTAWVLLTTSRLKDPRLVARSKYPF